MNDQGAWPHLLDSCYPIPKTLFCEYYEAAISMVGFNGPDEINIHIGLVK